MAPRPVQAISNDFDEVMRFLADLRIVDNPASAPLKAIAKKVHACTYSLITWRFRLTVIPDHGRPFVEEIASDALQILPQILLGYGKTAKLLSRGLLENTLRYVYFCDHPIEFQIMNREEKRYIGVDKLIEYMKSHPDYIRTEPRFDAIARLSSLYGELSAGIHGRRVKDLEMRTALKKIHYEQALADQEAEVVRRCTEVVNFILAIKEREALHRLSSEDRRIILRTLPREARDLWGGFE